MTFTIRMFPRRKVTPNTTGSSCGNICCQHVKSFWEKQMHSVLNHKKCDDTFKTVKSTLLKSQAYTHGLYPFLLTLNSTQTQILKPSSSAAALSYCIRRVTTFRPASDIPNPECKECLNRHLSFRKTNYLSTTSMHFITNLTFAEFIIQSQQDSSVKIPPLQIFSLSGYSHCTVKLSHYFIADKLKRLRSSVSGPRHIFQNLGVSLSPPHFSSCLSEVRGLGQDAVAQHRILPHKPELQSSSSFA